MSEICEACGKPADDIRTIQNAEFGFLMYLCKKHYKSYQDGKVSQSELLLIHNNYLANNRKQFLK